MKLENIIKVALPIGISVVLLGTLFGYGFKPPEKKMIEVESIEVS